MAPDLIAELEAVVGRRHVLVDPAITESYVTDWTGAVKGSTAAVVRPADTAEVAQVMDLCSRHGVAVVPQGGNTGLVGGSVPTAGEVVVSLRRLDAIGPVDTAAAQVTAGAGATLESVQAAAQAAGLEVGVDLAARQSATIGGIAATNAGGERVIAYGPARRQIVGLEVVLADGTVLRRLSGMVKDNTGYDLTGLLVGSEGTLGIITAVRLALFRRPQYRTVALVAVGGTAAAVEVLGAVRGASLGLDAAEIFYADGLELVCSHLGVSAPMAGEHPAYVLLECAGATEGSEDLAVALAGCGAVIDAVVATSTAERTRLWNYREQHTMAISAAGVPVKLDVAVPLGELAAFERAIRDLVASFPARVILFGHLAEGNLHVNVLGVAEDRRAEMIGAVLGTVADFGGSISAEHGIGRTKAPWLSLSRSPAEIATMRSLKGALDAQGLLNPGVLFGP